MPADGQYLPVASVGFQVGYLHEFVTELRSVSSNEENVRTAAPGAVNCDLRVALPSGDSRPNDEVLIKNFDDRKLAYERLRDLFLADGKVLLVAYWGVETPGSVLSVKPPVAELSLARYEQYLALLKEIGGKVVSRSEAGLPEACIYVWADGFAG